MSEWSAYRAKGKETERGKGQSFSSSERGGQTHKTQKGFHSFHSPTRILFKKKKAIFPEVKFLAFWFATCSFDQLRWFLDEICIWVLMGICGFESSCKFSSIGFLVCDFLFFVFLRWVGGRFVMGGGFCFFCLFHFELLIC